MNELLDDWFGQYLIVFEQYEFLKIYINQEELRGLQQEVFFKELDLNLRFSE